MTKRWVAFPYPDKAYLHDAPGLKKSWPRLHRGDCEPFPREVDTLEAWRHYHAGEFGAAPRLAAGLAPALADLPCGARPEALRPPGCPRPAPCP